LSLAADRSKTRVERTSILSREEYKFENPPHSFLLGDCGRLLANPNGLTDSVI